MRIAGINPHLRQIADDTAGEVLWYDGEPAATMTSPIAAAPPKTADTLGNDEERAPYLMQHSDKYCVRNGGGEWHSEVSMGERQRALANDGIVIPGNLRSVAILHRTPSGRVERRLR